MSMYKIVSVLSCNTIFKMFVAHRLGSEQSQSHHPKHPSPSLPPSLPDTRCGELREWDLISHLARKLSPSWPGWLRPSLAVLLSCAQEARERSNMI